MSVVPPAEAPKPGAVKAATFMVVSFPLRVLQFVLLVVLIVVGIATTIVWIGIPLLMLATRLVHSFGEGERSWVGRMLDRPIAPTQLESTGHTAVRKWLSTLTDSSTWRRLGYFMLAFPLGSIEFVIGLVGIVLVPVGMYVVPWLGWLHGYLAASLLGPNKARTLKAETQRLQASRARGVDAAEAERRRIERDLHDGAQQRLVSIAMSLGRAQAKIDDDPAAVRQLVDEAHADAKLAVSELRDLARGIYPAVLGDRGLDAALSSLASQCPVPVEVSVDERLSQQRPPQAVETTAYFTVGEALANVAKHAQARHVTVAVSRGEDAVTVEVTDDGKGGAELSAGGGLAGLADRASVIDGVVTVVSPVGGPTVLRADLPCQW